MPSERIFVEGMTLREISRKYDIPMNTVRGRYRRGLRTVKELSYNENLHNRPYRMEIAIGGGKKLLKAMNEKNITFAEIGRRTGVSANAIWEFVYNGRDMSSMRLAKICRAVGCSMDYVMGLQMDRV